VNICLYNIQLLGSVLNATWDFAIVAIISNLLFITTINRNTKVLATFHGCIHLQTR